MCGCCRGTRHGQALAATGWGGRMGALARIRAAGSIDVLTPEVIEGLLRELQPRLEDAIIVECALKTLLTLVKERGNFQLVFDAGGLDLVARALSIHGADLRTALLALDVIGHVTVDLSDAVLLTSADCLSEIVRVAVAAMHIQRSELDVFWSCSDLLFLLCGKCRAGKLNMSTDVAEQAVDVLRHALSDHINDLGSQAFRVLRTLQAMTVNENVAACAAAAGCIELVIAALQHADFVADHEVHVFGCRALSNLCMGSELRRIDACGFVEVAFESLRLFPDSLEVHASGLRMLWIYRVRLSGCALDEDQLGPDAVQAALTAMRLCCLRISSEGIASDCFGASLVDVMRLALDLLTSLNDTRPSSWLFPLLDEPETTALLKRTLRWLDRAGDTAEGMPAFVLRMTQGACCGCGELQDEKMKLCARCRRAPYCSQACQRSHWPEHKLECKKQPAGAAVGAREAG